MVPMSHLGLFVLRRALALKLTRHQYYQPGECEFAREAVVKVSILNLCIALLLPEGYDWAHNLYYPGYLIVMLTNIVTLSMISALDSVHLSKISLK